VIIVMESGMNHRPRWAASLLKNLWHTQLFQTVLLDNASYSSFIKSDKEQNKYALHVIDGCNTEPMDQVVSLFQLIQLFY
jgi:hypothetical protein